MDFYKSADLIIHDCECTPFRSGVHAHFDELATLPPEIKAKISLVHYQDSVLQDWETWQAKAKAAGFVGFVMAGQEMEIYFLTPDSPTGKIPSMQPTKPRPPTWFDLWCCLTAVLLALLIPLFWAVPEHYFVVMPGPTFLGGFGISSLVLDWYESRKDKQQENHSLVMER